MLMNLERARQIMNDHRLEGLVASSAENVTYVTGYASWTMYTFKDLEVYGVVSRDGATALVVPIDGIDFIAQRPAHVTRIYSYGTFHVEHRPGARLEGAPARIVELKESATHRPSAIEALKQALDDLGLHGGRIGLDERGIAPARWRLVEEALSDASITAANELFRKVRLVKTADEVRYLHRAAAAVESGIQAAFASAHVGMVEADLERVIRLSTVIAGADPGHCETSAGTRGAGCFPASDEYRLHPGDVIRSDCGARYHWYWADTGRTAVVGEPPRQLAAYFRALRAGIDALLEAIRPGTSVAVLADRAIATVRDNGIPNYQRHHVGHGIGLEMYEAPLLTGSGGSRDIHYLGRDDVLLEEGMVVNIELPYYELGLGGLQIEDTVVVRAAGPELLTTSCRDLVRLRE
jgi:Xaa-Pro dipeptidase